jgi:hypothetical protein
LIIEKSIFHYQLDLTHFYDINEPRPKMVCIIRRPHPLEEGGKKNIPREEELERMRLHNLQRCLEIYAFMRQNHFLRTDYYVLIVNGRIVASSENLDYINDIVDQHYLAMNNPTLAYIIRHVGHEEEQQLLPPTNQMELVMFQQIQM